MYLGVLVRYCINGCCVYLGVLVRYWGAHCDNYSLFVISIVIDSDRGHCDEHLKKKSTMKIEHVTYIWMFVCAMNFWAARNGKNLSFWLFRPNLHELGLFHPYFAYKCSFREISMIKIVILDQSKPISLILKI